MKRGRRGETLLLRWNLEDWNGRSQSAAEDRRKPAEHGVLELNLTPGGPLIRSLGVAPARDAAARPVLENVDPVTILTVGQRNLERRSGWTIFFDKVHQRPHTTHLAKLKLKEVRVESRGGSRVTVTLGELTAGSFKGELEFSLYPNCRLVQVEAVLSTEEDGRAILYDAGIAAARPFWSKTVWLDPEGKAGGADPGKRETARPLAVKHRVIAAENPNGSVAVFPAPHKYFYPLDFANNFKFAWHGKDFRGFVEGHGLGFRQPLDGDNRYVPWFNAPPRTKQRLGAFYLLTSGDGQTAIKETKRFTRGDRFAPLKGHRTFTSHYHVEHTLEYLKRQKEQGATGIPEGLKEPGFVKTFKDMGVEIVHLGEFHKGKTPRLKAPERLAQLKLMHEECDRLSTRKFLLLPGEEPNVHLGGHWVSLFPKPVYWVLNRGKDTPFMEQRPGYGTVYHVGNSKDVLNLFQKENGLNWTAHARIKGSTGFPDAYQLKDYFVSDTFLGAAWKAMPADLSQTRLGTRALDLQDDMANWGRRKYILGEVDVFKIEPDYELYAHMNINYLRLDKLPRYKEGWQPVLDCLREGKFFVTTGEILIEEFTVNGKRSGETVRLRPGEPVQINLRVKPTFPLSHANRVEGAMLRAGKRKGRVGVNLSPSGAFTDTTIQFNLNTKVASPGFGTTSPRTLSDPTRHSNIEQNGPFIPGQWIRIEVWDIAGNGAFTPARLDREGVSCPPRVDIERHAG